MKKPEIVGPGYWLLRKGLYGLKQAGRSWYLEFNDKYQTLGFKRCETDWSVHVRNQDGTKAMSATSVDDILLATASEAESDNITAEIGKLFTITDNGDMKWLLGCRVTRYRSRGFLILSQESYTTRILETFNMHLSNSANTPLPPKTCLSADQSPKTEAERAEMRKLPYCALVGKVMYLATTTRPDIMYAVRELAKFMTNYCTISTVAGPGVTRDTVCC